MTVLPGPKKYHPLLQLVAASTLTIFASPARITRVAAAIAPRSGSTAGRNIAPRQPRFSARRNFGFGFLGTGGVEVEPTLRMTSTSEIDRANVLESPSAERNKDPIREVLEATVYPPLIEGVVEGGRDAIAVLELAAGCGVHTTHLASSLSSTANEGAEGRRRRLGVEWHPSDPDPEARSSIDARARLAGLSGEGSDGAVVVLPANAWILGKSGGTACGDGQQRDRGDAGSSRSGKDGDVGEYEQHHDRFDLALCINMIHISPWEATLGLMECAGKVLRRGGMLVCYGPYKVGGTAAESNLNFDRALQSRNPGWGVRNLEDVIEVAKKEGLEFVQSIEMPANNMSVLFRKN